MLSVSTSDEFDVGGGDGSDEEMEKLSDGGRLILLEDMREEEREKGRDS